MPLAFTKPLKEKRVVEGQSATLECKLSRPADVTWFKDGKEIQPNEHFDITVDGTIHKLNLKKTSLNDEAEYTVKTGDISSKATLWIEGRYYVAIRPQLCDNYVHING